MLRKLHTPAGLAMAIALLGGAALPARAQEATTPPADAADTQDGLADIVVTAQKTAAAESLQRVPVAITAVDERVLAVGQITNLEQVGFLAPNVQLQGAGTVPGFANFSIRGAGINTSVRTIDPAVSIAFDGMPFAFPIATILDTFDVEAVEVLRGPQGVLFGRNATGGAVSVRTRRPSSTFAIEASTRFGNGKRRDFTGSVEGSLADGLRAKIAVARRYSEGLFPDGKGQFTPATLNPTGADTSLVRRHGGQETWLARGIVDWDATDRLALSLVGEIVSIDTDGNTGRLLSANTLLTSTANFGYTPPPFGTYFVDSELDGFSNSKARRATLTATYRVGAGVITSVTGYRNADGRSAVDFDGSPFPILYTGPDTDDSDQFSQELRFASTFSDDFRFTVGGYYSTLDFSVASRQRGINATTKVRFSNQGLSSQTSDTEALFGNFDLMAIPRLTLSAGARYTREHKALNSTIRANCATVDFGGCPSTFYQLEKTWRDVSPRFAANYQASDDVMLYASWTKGFRSGAYNNRPANPLGFGPADPESVRSFEAGFKSSLLNNHVRFNLAAYHAKYTDLQRPLTIVTPAGATTSVVNAGRATVRGFEAEVTALPVRGFELSGSVGYTHARYDEFDLNQNGVSSPAEVALKFDRVPAWTASASATYDFEVPGIPGGFVARTAYSYRDDSYSDPQNLILLPHYGLWDASFGYKPNDSFRILFYGRNLSNKNYWDLGTALSTGQGVFGGSPREYGVELYYKM